jgi:hypothetical protein
MDARTRFLASKVRTSRTRRPRRLDDPAQGPHPPPGLVRRGVLNPPLAAAATSADPAHTAPPLPSRPPRTNNNTHTTKLVEALGVDASLAQKKLQANKDLVGAFCDGTGPGTLRFYHQVRERGGGGLRRDGGGSEGGRRRRDGFVGGGGGAARRLEGKPRGERPPRPPPRKQRPFIGLSPKKPRSLRP